MNTTGPSYSTTEQSATRCGVLQRGKGHGKNGWLAVHRLNFTSVDFSDGKIILTLTSTQTYLSNIHLLYFQRTII